MTMHRVRADDELITVEADGIFDAFRKVRAMRPRAVAVSDTTGGPDELRTVEIPADVRDNSQTVTDYAFMRHRSPDKGVYTPGERDRELALGEMYFGYTVYTWHDVNQGDRLGRGAGQRCRFDLVVNRGGEVVHLFHTEFFTRVACGMGDWCPSYATHYTVLTDADGEQSDAVPYCDEHVREMRRNIAGLPMTLHLSEPLIIGQHD